MKKTLLAIFIVGVAIFTLASCSAGSGDVNNSLNSENSSKAEGTNEDGTLKGVNLNIEKDSITPTGVTLILKNDNAREYQYGSYYCVEEKKGDDWIELPYISKEEVGWDDIAYIIPAKQSSEEKVDWEWLYGYLEEGEYRITKVIYDFRAAGDYDTYALSAEFAILDSDKTNK